MEYEYVALSWTTHYPGGDTGFGADKDRLLAEGWQTDVQARFEPKRIGGACIMRRPIDEPRKWTKSELREAFDLWYRQQGLSQDAPSDADIAAVCANT